MKYRSKYFKKEIAAREAVKQAVAQAVVQAAKVALSAISGEGRRPNINIKHNGGQEAYRHFIEPSLRQLFFTLNAKKYTELKKFLCQGNKCIYYYTI